MQFVVPPPSANILALLQDVDAGAQVILNGSPLKGKYFQGNDGGYYERQVTLTSTDDLSAINFSVSGYSNRTGNSYRGVYTTEVIAGPDNATVLTDNYFSEITSIIPIDGNATNLTAGSGGQAVVVMPVNIISPRFGFGTYSFSLNNPDTLQFEIKGTNIRVNDTTELMKDLIDDEANVFEIAAAANPAHYQFPYDLAKFYPVLRALLVVLNTDDDVWNGDVTINYVEA
jgi:hypothetical protein